MTYDDDTNRIVRLHDRIKELEAEVERLQRLIYNNMPHILDEQTRRALEGK